MLNSTAVFTDYQTANTYYQDLISVADNAKAAFKAKAGDDASEYEAYLSATDAVISFWGNVLCPLLAQERARFQYAIRQLDTQTETGTPARAVGVIEGSDLNYREIKECLIGSVEEIQRGDLQCHELAWTERWIKAARRFPSLISVSTMEMLYNTNDIFKAAQLILTDSEFSHIAHGATERTSDWYDAINNADWELRAELQRRGIGRAGRSLIDFIDIEKFFNL